MWVGLGMKRCGVGGRVNVQIVCILGAWIPVQFLRVLLGWQWEQGVLYFQGAQLQRL